MPTTYAGQVAAEVRAEMARQRRTHADIARALGASEATVGRRLSGDVPFKISELSTVAEFLSVPLSALLPSESAKAAS